MQHAAFVVSLACCVHGLNISSSDPCETWYDSTERGPWVRNVKDYGAVGDGVHDDTAAITAALISGRQDIRSTEQQLKVYLPPGTYLVSDQLQLYFYTMLAGNQACPATLKLKANSVPAGTRKYVVAGPASCNGCQHTDDFYYQLNNVVIDMTEPGNEGAFGVHWAVSQGTSLRNVVIKAGNSEGGIFCENGSGGLMSDVTVDGGRIGLVYGSQQWTFLSVKVMNSRSVGIQILWNWVFTFIGLEMTNCPVGIQYQGTAGGLVVADSSFTNVGTAIWTDFHWPAASRSIVLERVATSGVANLTACYMTPNCSESIVPAPAYVRAWREGHAIGETGMRGFFTPQRPDVPVENRPLPAFTSPFNVYQAGAKGDCKADDTAALQKAIDQHDEVFLPYGCYLVSNTLHLRSDTKLIGDSMSEIRAAKSAHFTRPITTPMLSTPNDRLAETMLVKLILTAEADVPNVLLLRWGAGRGAAWDVHVRLYHDVKEMIHVTTSGGGYIENMWGWVADHNIDTGALITVKTPHGMRVNSKEEPLYLVGAAFEHCYEFQFLIHGASNVFMAIPQTETPYWQVPPTAYGITVENSNGFVLFGGGFYNWFQGVQEVIFSVISTTNATLYLPNVNSPKPNDPVQPQGVGFILHGQQSVVAGTPYNESGFCSHFAVLEEK
eukprot:TRINITY_DN8453_c0_g2_i2.p1 TRINITY_DN8453_c0_g2~~TRINITY_DN8453_c0_g2_i2.p1  ORF type:complete len:665 (+),score=169.02 TRINITY_DN8453_c0_g2_i2:393-2387(+)